MKTQAAKSYEQMWNKIETDLLVISSDRYSEDIPELKLLIAIVVQAAKDRDLEYFSTESYKTHAKLIKISPVFMKGLLIRAWKMEDSGKIWVPTPELIEEY